MRDTFEEAWPRGTIVVLKRRVGWYEAKKGALAKLTTSALEEDDEITLKWLKSDDRSNGEDDGNYERELFKVATKEDLKGYVDYKRFSAAKKARAVNREPDYMPSNDDEMLEWFDDNRPSTKRRKKKAKATKKPTNYTSKRLFAPATFEAPLMIRRGKIID